MSRTFLLVASLVVVTCGACGQIPLQQSASTSEAPVVTWKGLYAQNCSGCHGADGSIGGARPLRDASYLASVSRNGLIDIVRRGQGVLMPAMDVSQGGAISSEQIAQLVDGMMSDWGQGGKPHVVAWAGELGSPQAGHAVYAATCQSCHGLPDGVAAGTRGSVTDPNYLRLVSNQALRSAVIFGRSDLGGLCNGPYPGQPASRTLSSSEVADVVAFLASKRPNFGGHTP